MASPIQLTQRDGASYRDPPSMQEANGTIGYVHRASLFVLPESEIRH